MKFIVRVEENSHQGQGSYTHGEFDNREVALAAAKQIVDESLHSLYASGMNPETLYRHYTAFGEDAYIISDDPDCGFSGWSYARERCEAICQGK